jgi:hypothetical protein
MWEQAEEGQSPLSLSNCRDSGDCPSRFLNRRLAEGVGTRRIFHGILRPQDREDEMKKRWIAIDANMVSQIRFSRTWRSGSDIE